MSNTVHAYTCDVNRSHIRSCKGEKARKKPLARMSVSGCTGHVSFRCQTADFGRAKIGQVVVPNRTHGAAHGRRLKTRVLADQARGLADQDFRNSAQPAPWAPSRLSR